MVMKKILVVLLSIGLNSCFVIDPIFVEPQPIYDYKVLPLYVIPADQVYDNNNAGRVWRAMYATQNWYQTATGGMTFEFLDPDNVFENYFAYEPVEYYEDDWWTKLLEEMIERGYPVQSKGTILMIFIEGISDVGGGELALGGWSCEGDCGAAIIPISLLQAPTNLPTDLGTVYHELGHALGLTHPVEQEDLPLSAEEEVMLYSVMCQSDLRAGTTSGDHGLLSSEKAALIGNPFIKENVIAYKDNVSARIINYPVLGEIPEPEISHEVLPNSVVSFSTNIDNALLYYWDFGDGSVSFEKTPSHSYNNFGLYNVTLMVTTEQYMSARTNSYINLN